MTYAIWLFLVFAGMMIYHLLWYTDRTDEDQLRLKLASENEELKRQFEASTATLTEVEDKYSRQTGQMNVLQQLCDDWSGSREQIERERTELEVELNSRAKRYDEMLGALQIEKDRRMVVEGDLHALHQEHAKKVGNVESTWQKKYSKLESTLQQRQTELKKLTGQNERTAEKLHQAEGRIAELTAELQSQKTLLESATKNVGGLEKEYVSLESSLAHSSDLLKKSQADCASALSARKHVESELRELRTLSDEQQQRIIELEAKSAEYNTLRKQIAQMEEAVATERTRLETVTRERDQALQAEKTAIGMSTGLQNRIDNQENTIKLLRSEREKSLESLKLELNARTEIESTFNERVSGFVQRLEERENTIRSLKDQRRDYIVKCDTEKQSKIELESTYGAQMNSLKEKIKEREEVISDLTRQRDEILARCDEEKNKRVEIESTVAERMAGLNDKLQDRQRTIAELSQQCNEVSVRCEEEKNKRVEIESTVEERLSGMKQRLAERDETIRLLTSQRDEWQLKSQEFDRMRMDYESRLASASNMGDTTELERQLTESQAECMRLSARCEQMSKDSQSDKELLHLTQKRLDELAKLRLSHSSELEETLSELEKLRIKHATCDATILKLREERAAALARLASQKQIEESEPAIIRFESRPDYDEEYGGHTKMHDKRGLVYTEAPRDRDDLKLISGIAEVLEKRLNDYGIYTFKQVMNWNKRSIGEFSTLLAFKDRIDRDDWKGQARYLYKKKQRDARDQDRVAARAA